MRVLACRRDGFVVTACPFPNLGLKFEFIIFGQKKKLTYLCRSLRFVCRIWSRAAFQIGFCPSPTYNVFYLISVFFTPTVVNFEPIYLPVWAHYFCASEVSIIIKKNI